MIGQSPERRQPDLFNPLLEDFIDMKHELVLLARKIDWDYFQKEFAPLYSHRGQKAMPICLMIGCLILKHLYDLGDETLAKEWVMNPYMQYFCGETIFQHRFPCDPSDFVHFRKRIGEKGIEKIFLQSVKLHGKDAEEKLHVSDTTVQGNNTTFPTDQKLYKKVIEGCHDIAQQEGVEQRQSYEKTSKELLRQTHNGKHPRRWKKARAARKKLRTLARRVIRELERKLDEPQIQGHLDRLEIYKRLVEQEPQDKNKIYSPHKPYTTCIAKGKASTPYEFGNKVGLVITSESQLVVAIRAFEGNPHDSKTIEPLLEWMKQNGLKQPKQIVYDRGGRGKKEINGVEILTPGKPLKNDSGYERAKKRKPFRRRAAIEPVIGHLKKDFRMQENYMKGKNSPTINALLAATAWNLKKLMRKLLRELLRFLFSVFPPCPKTDSSPSVFSLFLSAFSLILRKSFS